MLLSNSPKRASVVRSNDPSSEQFDEGLGGSSAAAAAAAAAAADGQRSRQGSIQRARTRSASVFIRTDSRESLGMLKEDEAHVFGTAHHPPTHSTVDGKPFANFDSELAQQHADELNRLEQILEEKSQECEHNEFLVNTLRKDKEILRDEIQRKADYTAELESELVEAHERETHSQQYQESMQKEIQEYHERQQEELNIQQQNLSDKKEQMNTQEESQQKRKMKLEEMQSNLAVTLAELDERESGLQQQLNQQQQQIRVWAAEKQELATREEDHRQWVKEYKKKEEDLAEQVRNKRRPRRPR
jgi:hypothetical protein